jgi:hypothetical protein
MASTKSTPKDVDLLAQLVKELRAAKIKVEVRPAPRGNYSSLLLDGEVNIAYVDKQSARGIKVKPAVLLGDLPKSLKGFTDNQRGNSRFGVATVVSDEAGVKRAAKAIVLAAKLVSE